MPLGWEEEDTANSHAQTMTDTHDEVEHRAYHRAAPGDIEFRELAEEEDGLFAVRMPIASTGEVRNEGDEPLTREEIDGMARQIDERDVGVFLAHGDSFEITDARYGQTERLGTWREADVRTAEADDERAADEADLLVASAVMADPETLPAATGRFREALAIIKEQAKRDIPLSASIGWREDDDMPGGNDLMEASIVGIPADPRTVTQGSPAVAVARAAVDAGADLGPLTRAFEAAVMGPDADTTDERHLSEKQAEMALRMLKAYRQEQGDGSVENFEAWLWNLGHQFEDDERHAGMTALQEFYRETTPLEDPVSERFGPFLRDRADGDTSTNEMSDTDDEESDEQSADDTTEEETERQEAPEWAERLLEMQQDQTDTLQSIADAVRQDDDEDEDDDEDDEEDDDEESSADEPDEEQESDDADEQAADEVAELRDALDTLREGGIDVEDVDLPDAESDTDRDTEDSSDADPNEDATKAVLR